MDFTGKNVLVSGMALSGQSTALLLKSLDANVTAQDMKPHEEINWTFSPEESSIQLYMGQNPDEIVGQFDLIIISPGIPIDTPFLNKARLIGVPIWGEVELAYTLCPCPVMAVTGTNGKTTVAMLAGEIMRAHNPRTFVAGNIGVPFSGLVRTLAPDGFIVAEISSFQMETAHTFKPYIGAVLNITPDHLDRHYTMEAYALLKEKIFFNQTPDDFAVLNYDDPYCLAMKPLGNVVFFSKKAELAQGVFLDNGRIRAKLGDIGGPSDVYLCDINQIKGLPENALAATAMCLCAGAPAEAVTRTLMTFPGVEHRIEYVAEINGVTYYNDSKATNTDAAIKALEAMRGPVVLIGGGYDKHADYGDWVNAFAKGKVKHLLLIGQTAEAIASECHAQGYNYFDYADTLGDAVTAAAALAKPGDCVLLSPACASWGMFNNYEERGRLFKQYVRALETEQA